MKIAIFTQPLRCNYGGLLQAWALQSVLRRMGHDVVTLDALARLGQPWWRWPLVLGKRVLQRLLGHRVEVFREWHYNHDYPVISQHTRPFVERNIRVRTLENSREVAQTDYDAFVVGSDQVWRPKYNRLYGRCIENAYLDFAEGWQVRRVAYAASFGTDKWEYSPVQGDRCRQLAQQFDAVSVREASGVALCREHLGVEAQHVLDPTLLLDEQDYRQLMQQRETVMPDGELMCYLLDENKGTDDFVSMVAQATGKRPFKSNAHFNDKHAPLATRIQPPVEQWLRNFSEAAMVLTDSFHACVFSILFKKPFLVRCNVNRGVARFASLLGTLGLEDRMVSDDATVAEIARKAAAPIDYTAVYERLETLRQGSRAFLTQALGDR